MSAITTRNRRAAGLCVTCGVDAGGKVRCPECNERASALARAKRAAGRLNKTTGRTTCRRCGQRGHIAQGCPVDWRPPLTDEIHTPLTDADVPPATRRGRHKYRVRTRIGAWRVVSLSGRARYLLECEGCSRRRTVPESGLKDVHGCGKCGRRGSLGHSVDHAGRVIGCWRIERKLERRLPVQGRNYYSGGAVYVATCVECGATHEEGRTLPWLHMNSCRCRMSSAAQSRGDGVRAAQARRDSDGLRIDLTTPWDEDLECRVLVAMHPGGMTLDEIGAVTGYSRQRIEQIEKRALEKVAGARSKLNPALRDLWEHVMERPETHWERIIDHMAPGRFGWSDDDAEDA